MFCKSKIEALLKGVKVTQLTLVQHFRAVLSYILVTSYRWPKYTVYLSFDITIYYVYTVKRTLFSQLVIDYESCKYNQAL